MFTQIKWKLTLAILATSTVVLVLGCVAVLVYDSVTSKRHLVARLDTIADIAAAYASAALASGNVREAEKTLFPLSERQELDLVCLRMKDGEPFFAFPTNHLTPSCVARLTGQEEGHVFEGNGLALKRKVYLGREEVGSVVICANLDQQSARAKAFLAIALSALAGLIGVAWLLASRLQRLVSDPIAQLVRTANYITRHKDYRVRAESTSKDEIGMLVVAFNQMVSEVERRNHRLEQSEKRLKLALHASRMGTWEWNLCTDEVSWSDEVRTMLGAPSKQASLATFGSHIHPDDAERVLAKLRIAAERQVPFSDEYRIRTGNAPWRWIAHHGQMLHDASRRPCVLAGIVEDITARKQAESERQKLVANLLHAEEDERRRIARELHDTTAQRLALLKINFALLCDAMATLPDARLVAESRHILDQALLEIRSLTYVLHPPLIEEFGLVSALGDFAAGVTQRNGVKVELQSADFQGRLSPAVELALFRVAQESVANAIRHSGTKEILIRLARDAFEARIEIQDFGHGFPVHPGISRPRGVGIASMQERLALVGGTFDIESDSHGVCVLASVPAPADSRLPG